ncbi:MAG TPA: sulfatase-like hydrolase/transferase, partial [Opitutaceae bacterium]|nr:sulfatase-like hydrolase/transferase [Opitutaceae bacterium]
MPLRSRRCWIWLLVCSWLGALGLFGAAPNRPNFLIILADDLGYSDLGCYGGEISTPTLDELALNGLRFTQAYSTARCWPSRASVMTGYYAQQVRRDSIPGFENTGGNRGIRPVWAPLLSEILQTAGYRTYHSGKWHIDGQPLALGFDLSFEIKGPGQSQYFSAKGNTVENRPQASSPDYYATTAVADHAIQALREHAAQFSSQPFFHYLCFTAPHFPLQAPAADIACYHGRYDEGWNALSAQRHARQVKLELANHPLPIMEEDVGPPYAFPKDVAQLGPHEVTRPLPWSTLTPEQRRFQSAKMEIHAAMIDRMDREIGRIVAQLRELNLLENTVIVFASDNGASAEIMVRGDGHDRAASPGSASTFLSLGP